MSLKGVYWMAPGGVRFRDIKRSFADGYALCRADVRPGEELILQINRGSTVGPYWVSEVITDAESFERMESSTEGKTTRIVAGYPDYAHQHQ
jgi:hypothetical protein